MKTLITATALSLALVGAAFAQDARPATPATPAAPAVKVETPKATPATPASPTAKVEVPKPATAPAPAAKVEAAKPATPATPAKADPKATVKLININKATPAELDALPKIGEARTKAIIAGRPYKSTEELIAKKIIPQDAYDAIKGQISVK